MSPIELRPLDSGNWRDFVRLSVADEQRDFVDVNLFVIAEAGMEGYEPFGMYDGDEAVAMVVFADLSGGVGMVHHIMVGEGLQGRGYGRKTMEALLELARGRGFRRVVLSYWPDNPAVKLYESLGFRHTGETWGDGEPVMRLVL